MTDTKLQEILQSDESLTLSAVKDIIYELKNDCVQFNVEPYKAGFYNGEMNAFYICLDLLEKVDNSFKKTGLHRRFDMLADTVGLKRTADPREILDVALKKLDKVDPHFVGIEERVAKLEAWQENFRMSFMKGICNEIFGTGDYVDTDSIKQDEREAETSSVIEALRPNPMTPENSNIRKCCPEEVNNES